MVFHFQLPHTFCVEMLLRYLIFYIVPFNPLISFNSSIYVLIFHSSMAEYSVPLVCRGRSFNGILRSLPLKVVFSASLNVVVSGIARCHWAWNWCSWCLMACLAVPEIRNGSRQLTSLCPEAVLAFDFLSYQRSHYMVTLGSVKSWVYNSGTWLTSAQQGLISPTELQPVHRTKQLLPSAFLAFIWQVSKLIFF